MQYAALVLTLKLEIGKRGMSLWNVLKMNLSVVQQHVHKDPYLTDYTLLVSHNKSTRNMVYDDKVNS